MTEQPPGTVPLTVRLELRTPGGSTFGRSESEHEVAPGDVGSVTVRLYEHQVEVPIEIPSEIPAGHRCVIEIPVTVTKQEWRRMELVRNEYGEMTSMHEFHLPRLPVGFQPVAPGLPYDVPSEEPE